MAAPDYKVRFSEAASLLNYGFANCKMYRDTMEERDPLPGLSVQGGVEEEIALTYGGDFSYLSMTGEDFSLVEKSLELPESVTAPVEEGQKVGSLIYTLEGKELGRVDILAAEEAQKAGYGDCLKKVWRQFLLGNVAF